MTYCMSYDKPCKEFGENKGLPAGNAVMSFHENDEKVNAHKNAFPQPRHCAHLYTRYAAALLQILSQIAKVK